MSIKIFLADDHQMFREALFHLIGTQADLQVVGQTGRGDEVQTLVAMLQPDVVCVDIQMPGINGIEATRKLIAAFPALRVIALSAYSDARYVRDMIAAGASAYVTKAEASDELLRAIRAAQQGKVYLCPDVALALRDDHSNTPPRVGERLSARENQVAQRVAQGLTSLQIADQLCIAASTVEVHRRNIMRKLRINSVAQLTRLVVDQEQHMP
jgi:two-component system NarL family response regulator